MSKLRENTALCGLERAPRYDIQMGVRYRPSCETEWREAQTENISRSGILFRAREPIDVGTLVEMRFVLPRGMGGRGDAAGLCQGWIARTVPPTGKSELATMVASILTFRSSLGGIGDES